ncbi:hypothetical protein ACVXG7_19355 [Enterobacter hormaechei]
MSMGESKSKPGTFIEKVQDDANELVINVSLENRSYCRYRTGLRPE